MAPYERLYSYPKIWLFVFLFVVLTFGSSPEEHHAQLSSNSLAGNTSAADLESWCPLPEKPKDPNDGLKPPSIFADKASVDKQVHRLSAAVHVSTVSYDDTRDVGKKPFFEFHGLLKELFPFV